MDEDLADEITMNNLELILILIVGIFLMCIVIAIQMKWYKVAYWKGIVIAFVLAVTGLLGSRFWYFVENGYFRGRSFYGVIFLAPIVFFFVAKFIKIDYGKTLDFVAPAGCLTLTLVKIQCLRDGCCDGVVLFIDENRNYVKFPSQIVEMAVFFVLFIILFIMSKKEKNRGKIFQYFLIFYGISRFVLDFFRDHVSHFAFGLSAGSFWSLCALVLGILWLWLLKLKHKTI